MYLWVGMCVCTDDSVCMHVCMRAFFVAVFRCCLCLMCFNAFVLL